VYGFRCYDNIHVGLCKLIALYTANAYSAEREMSASACTRSMAGMQQQLHKAGLDRLQSAIHNTSVVDNEVLVLTSVADAVVAEDPGKNLSEPVSLDLHGRLAEVRQHADVHLMQRQQRRRELEHQFHRRLTHTAI